MRDRHRLLNLVAAVIATSATVIVAAQEPQKQLPEKPAESAQGDQSDSTILCYTFLTPINVSVTDSINRPILGLTHEDFAIAEDGVKQEIAFFTDADSPLSFDLVFHISDYKPLKLMAWQTARSFAGQIRSTDEVTIPQLKANSETVRGANADERKLEDALNKISLNNKSSLFDVIAEGIKYTQEKRQYLRNITVVITDGLGLSGAASDRDAAYAILRRGAPVYFIILDDGRYGSHTANQSRVRQTRNLLTRLAVVSGGLALVVNSEDEISAATEQIIHRLKNQYTMGYHPTNEKYDGSFRYVRVTVTPKDKRKVKVFAPLGYYAVDPEKIREEKNNDK
ncbi:MAG: VWA domain-containing protein [Blastocatellia bacterium]